jgi:DNA-binding response OmpR family regulator
MSKAPAQSIPERQLHAGAQPPSGPRPRILVVDDEEDMAWGIQINLEGEGYDVAVAQSGQAALELHRSFRPELILLDLKLPDIHGFEVLRRIRAIDSTVRILIVSCLIEPEQRATGFNTGADDYQIKPFTISNCSVACSASSSTQRYSPSDANGRGAPAADSRIAISSFSIR